MKMSFLSIELLQGPNRANTPLLGLPKGGMYRPLSLDTTEKPDYHSKKEQDGTLKLSEFAKLTPLKKAMIPGSVGIK